jgi:hypothetical protein
VVTIGCALSIAVVLRTMDNAQMAPLGTGDRKLHFDYRVFWRCEMFNIDGDFAARPRQTVTIPSMK